jgi:tRNA(Ile)-lysidine synthase TilS/MesJ
MAPRVLPDNPEYPVVIRPLALVPEALIVEYASTLQLPQAGVCRYKEQLESGDRVYFKNVISSLSEHIPDLRSNIAHSLQKVEINHLLIPPGAEK